MASRKLYRPALFEDVTVVWDDAQYEGDFDGAPIDFDAKLALLETSGFFVSMTREAVTVAGTRDVPPTTMRHYMTIPRKLVREIRPKQAREVTA